MNTKGNTDGSCAGAIISILSSPFIYVWRGYVLTILWGWFIVPTFGIKAITIPQAIGLSLIVSFLTYQASKSVFADEEEPKKSILQVILSFIIPATCLLIGWIVNHWM